MSQRRGQTNFWVPPYICWCGAVVACLDLSRHGPLPTAPYCGIPLLVLVLVLVLLLLRGTAFWLRLDYEQVMRTRRLLDRLDREIFNINDATTGS